MINQPIIVESIPIFKDNYIWLLFNSEKDKVIAVDPGDGSKLIDYLTFNRITLEAILITHHHHDHIGGINALIQRYDVNVYGPQNERIEGVTHPVAEGHCIEFPFLKSPCQILDIPGHTLGHIAYLLPGILFCGDTLFSAGCGRLFEGSAEQMYYSLQKIASLPGDTKLYCTHEYTLENLQFAKHVEPNNEAILKKIEQVSALRKENKPSLPTTINEELQINPFLRCHLKEIGLNAQRYVGAKLNGPIEVFQALRAWKDVSS